MADSATASGSPPSFRPQRQSEDALSSGSDEKEPSPTGYTGEAKKVRPISGQTLVSPPERPPVTTPEVRHARPVHMYAWFIEEARKAAQWHGFLSVFYSISIDATVFLQLLLAAAITIFSVVPGDHSVATGALGAIATLVAGLLARYKGTNQPQRAIAHSTAMALLEKECYDYIVAHGDGHGSIYDADIERLAARYADIEEDADKAERGQFQSKRTAQQQG